MQFHSLHFVQVFVSLKNNALESRRTVEIRLTLQKFAENNIEGTEGKQGSFGENGKMTFISRNRNE